VTAAHLVILISAIVAGACVGSFVNVVIHRLPRALDEPNEFDEVWDTNPWRSVVGGESRCDGCGRRLGVLDLVPVVSWIALRGRCRTCGTRIGAYHPLVEALVPALGVLAWIEMDRSWQLGVVLWLIPVGLAVSVIDLRTFMVPTRVIWPAFGVAVLISVIGALVESEPRWLWSALVGLVVTAGPLTIIWFALPAGMGFGDVRLAVLAGWTVGFAATGDLRGAATLAVVVLAMAAVMGLVLGVVALGARGRKAKVPFGPAILIATYVCCLFAPRILDGLGVR
jgi:leader peptidase (prepilin peptidase)/N-methyltransferase